MSIASNTIVINEPELLLPDERLPFGVVIQARSSFIGGEYGSLRNLIEKRKRAEQMLNMDMAEWQRDISLPARVVYSVRDDSTSERLFVFGEIPDMDQLTKSDRAAGITDPAHLRRLQARIDNALRRGWLYGRWYSRVAPAGEWGVMHKRYVQQPLDENEFEQCRARGWVTGAEKS